jgi:hypothetical protein
MRVAGHRNCSQHRVLCAVFISVVLFHAQLTNQLGGIQPLASKTRLLAILAQLTDLAKEIMTRRTEQNLISVGDGFIISVCPSGPQIT